MYSEEEEDTSCTFTEQRVEARDGRGGGGGGAVLGLGPQRSSVHTTSAGNGDTTSCRTFKIYVHCPHSIPVARMRQGIESEWGRERETEARGGRTQARTWRTGAARFVCDRTDDMCVARVVGRVHRALASVHLHRRTHAGRV